MDKLEALPPPPGVVGSLKAGFDVIASNISVILLPLALDLFLWLGPRLRVDRIFQSLFDEMARYAAFSGLPSADLKAFQENSSIMMESRATGSSIDRSRLSPGFSLNGSRIYWSPSP